MIIIILEKQCFHYSGKITDLSQTW